ncbi:ATP-binding cassette domain-containing protein [Deferribacterales bacterium Es71-Z0220]|uniref:energy-coupling factor ABC transporter ATP-binding protein n=1 Tax=Deferrivibrio essentukiensis TaxID=2880922 RepID=UPI001F61042A|nr:ATP-binding cassette domain-containing protein [Deferrivibrio essentukiensis]MCB4203951.1 ATP-binding cassette domain-containing protein [Deferrivibrio essentukiensis]
MSHHFIKIQDLNFEYSDGTKALEHINLYVTHGESIAILGSNGAGKSTLLKHLNGTLLPTNGEVNIGGITATKKTLQKIRSAVGIVFQNTDNQLFMPTVFENVAFGPRNFGLEGEHLKETVEKALTDVGAIHLSNKHPFRLSGGEKRKVCIASVLACNPEILVLDEPTAEVDPKGLKDIVTLLNSFSHTKVISTHNLKFATAVCKRGVVLKRGKVIFDGEMSELMKNVELLKEAEILEEY